MPASLSDSIMDDYKVLDEKASSISYQPHEAASPTTVANGAVKYETSRRESEGGDGGFFDGSDVTWEIPVTLLSGIDCKAGDTITDGADTWHVLNARKIVWETVWQLPCT